jgi:hypothetical protein
MLGLFFPLPADGRFASRTDFVSLVFAVLLWSELSFVVGIIYGCAAKSPDIQYILLKNFAGLEVIIWPCVI